MTRSLLFVSAGLIAAFSFTIATNDAEAGNRRNRGCCQPSGYSHSRHSSHCGDRGYRRNNDCCGSTGYAHTGYVGYQQPMAYTPATTACCAPQATCCGGTSMGVTAIQPANYSAPQPPVGGVEAAPLPNPGN